MAAKISNFFKKKPPKIRQQGSSVVDSDDDDGYQDPITSCPTIPPSRITPAAPSYPPPRPASPKSAGKNATRRDDYQDPWDSKGRNASNTNPHARKDTYQDPYDSKMNSSQDYADPFDTKFAENKEKERQKLTDDVDEDYDEPYEERNPQPLNDTYEDPWDTRRQIDYTEGLDRPRSVSASQAVNIKQPNGPKDDYSDPWDSRVSGSVKSVEYDDTYSEPYDKGKKLVLDERRRKSEMNNDDDDDLYDMPYEEQLAIGIKTPVTPTLSDARPQKPASKHQKDINPQKVPPKVPKPYSGAGANAVASDANKPPGGGGGDYDSPWEWDVKKMENEFEKRFSVKDHSTKSVKPQPQPRKKPSNPNANPIEKPARTNPPVVNNAQPMVNGYQVDPTIPLENQGWFHGHIRRGQAESLLHNQPDCSYLIRNSESSKIDFSLSLRNRGEAMHLKISCRNGKYILGINSRPYDTIPEMIHHYSMNMLNIRGAEHVKLQYPVFQENMYFTVEPGS